MGNGSEDIREAVVANSLVCHTWQVSNDSESDSVFSDAEKSHTISFPTGPPNNNHSQSQGRPDITSGPSMLPPAPRRPVLGEGTNRRCEPAQSQRPPLTVWTGPYRRLSSALTGNNSRIPNTRRRRTNANKVCTLKRLMT